MRIMAEYVVICSISDDDVRFLCKIHGIEQNELPKEYYDYMENFQESFESWLSSMEENV